MAPTDDITTSSLCSEDLTPVPANERKWGMRNYAALWIGIVCLSTSCQRVFVLDDKDFDHGDWLLVKWDGTQRAMDSVQVIDDEYVLKTYSSGIYIWSSDAETTYDGGLELYKDGQLVERCDFLSLSDLHESDQVRTAFRPSERVWVTPTSADRFRQVWDSLAQNPGGYVANYQLNPADSRTIAFFRFKE